MGDFAISDPIWNFAHLSILHRKGKGDFATLNVIRNFARFAIFAQARYGRFCHI